MNRPDVPTFPEFTWDSCSWVTSARLPAWSGFQIRNGPYGSVSDTGLSDGRVQIVFAPEGRDDSPLLASEIELVKWVIENEVVLHDGAVKALFDAYPRLRGDALGWIDEEEASEILPEVQSVDELKQLVGISSINVHQVVKNQIPYIGIELGCTWDDEHGLGILLHGSEPLEIGGADTAILLWIAERHAK